MYVSIMLNQVWLCLPLQFTSSVMCLPLHLLGFSRGIYESTKDHSMWALMMLMSVISHWYEFQVQYGSIGWAVGATLGYAQAARNKRVIASIGDGSFPVTAQDVSTMLRCEQRTIIFLIELGNFCFLVDVSRPKLCDNAAHSYK